jgi:hypothetical protein
MFREIVTVYSESHTNFMTDHIMAKSGVIERLNMW